MAILARDAFVGVANDASIQGQAWDAGGIAWLTPTQLTGDGAGAVKFTGTLTGNAAIANFVPPDGATEVGVFFTVASDRPVYASGAVLSMHGAGSTPGSSWTSGIVVYAGAYNTLVIEDRSNATDYHKEIAISSLTPGVQYYTAPRNIGGADYCGVLYSGGNPVTGDKGTLLATTPTLTIAAARPGTAKLAQMLDFAPNSSRFQAFMASDNSVVTVPVGFSGPVPTRNGAVGSAASFANAGFFAGSATPFAYTLQAGTLPAGLTINPSTGVISGTPTAAGTQSGIVIRATDANGATADTNAYSIVIGASNAAPTFPGSIANITGTGGSAITPVNVSGQFSDTDALAYSASLVGVAWPSGLVVNPSTGIISGTVATSTTTGLRVRATDTAGQTVDSNTFNATFGAAAAGTLKTQAFKNGTGQVLANLTGLNVAVLAVPALTLVKGFTGRTTNGTGVCTVSDALIVAGTKYAHITTNAAGTVIGAELITAT